MAEKILVAGSTNIDLVLPTPYIPAPGETLISDGNYVFTPGGKGANTAVAAVQMGAGVVFCSRVGDDAYGESLVSLFASRGIDTQFIKTDKTEPTGLAVVTVERGGTNRIIAYPGANAKLCASDIDAAFESCPDAVLTQFELNRDAVIAAARCAHTDDVPLFVDAGAAEPDFPLDKLLKVEIFSPKVVETEFLTVIRPNNLNNCLRASIALCSRVSIRYVVLKLGGRGCYVYDGKYCDLVSPYDVESVDTTAAGDAFTAALTAEYLRTGDIIAAARFANAAGALTVTKKGAIKSLPVREEVEALMNGNR
ncbi:MAG: ribokinase [Clostridia bacterium]|nr:ribokinase [Clostridia bacterium]